ncbi:MAG: hypothetical protein SNJ71_06565 [Bacteroidales bacterium]
MKKLILLNILFILFFNNITAQPVISRWQDNTYNPYLRYVYGNSPENHSAIQPYLLNETDSLVKFDTLNEISTKNIFLNWLLNKNVFQKKGNDYSISLNPIFEFEKSWGSDSTGYINTRGFLIEGTLGKTISFSSSFRENQSKFSDFRDSIVKQYKVIPGFGKPKYLTKSNYDYASVEGYVGYSATKYVTVLLGNGKHFWGDGYRSLFLSDAAFSYPYLMIQARFWRIKYVNMYAQFTDLISKNHFDFGYNRSWGTLRYLSLNATKWLNFGVFEAVVWENSDTVGHRGFDVQYLNPVIFMRPAEFSVGSPDNVLMGGSIKITLLKKYVFYSQLILDEFNFEHVKARDGWWANKWGYQVGLRTFDFLGIKNLDWLGEYNRVRPFTYSHWKPTQNYGHYNQPLAHILGANFSELNGTARYNYKRFYTSARLSLSIQGLDRKIIKNKKTYIENNGTDIFKSYTTREKENNNFVGQGLKNRRGSYEFTLSYLVNPWYGFTIAAGISGFVQHNAVSSLRTDSYIFIAFKTSLRNVYNNF